MQAPRRTNTLLESFPIALPAPQCQHSRTALHSRGTRICGATHSSFPCSPGHKTNHAPTRTAPRTTRFPASGCGPERAKRPKDLTGRLPTAAALPMSVDCGVSRIQSNAAHSVSKVPDTSSGHLVVTQLFPTQRFHAHLDGTRQALDSPTDYTGATLALDPSSRQCPKPWTSDSSPLNLYMFEAAGWKLASAIRPLGVQEGTPAYPPCPKALVSIQSI